MEDVAVAGPAVWSGLTQACHAQHPGGDRFLLWKKDGQKGNFENERTESFPSTECVGLTMCCSGQMTWTR